MLTMSFWTIVKCLENATEVYMSLMWMSIVCPSLGNYIKQFLHMWHNFFNFRRHIINISEVKIVGTLKIFKGPLFIL